MYRRRQPPRTVDREARVVPDDVHAELQCRLRHQAAHTAEAAQRKRLADDLVADKLRLVTLNSSREARVIGAVARLPDVRDTLDHAA